MKSIFSILAILLISCSCGKDKIHPHVKNTLEQYVVSYMDVGSFIGQSDMCGRPIGPMLTTPIENSHIISYNTKAKDTFQRVLRGVNTSDKLGMYGIQYFIALKRPGYYFQPAFGGQYLSAWDEGQFMWDYTVKSVAYIKDYAKKMGKTARFNYAVFYQGESDALLKTFDTAAYKSKLENLILRYRKLTNYNTKFIIVEFAKCKGGDSYNMRLIRDVHRKVGALPNNVTILNNESDGCIDGLHANEATLQRIATEALQIMK